MSSARVNIVPMTCNSVELPDCGNVAVKKKKIGVNIRLSIFTVNMHLNTWLVVSGPGSERRMRYVLFLRIAISF